MKLSPGSSYDYTTIGIACHMKDYRFAFFLNEKLGFQFKRTEDLTYSEGINPQKYAFFIFRDNDERRHFYLVSNYHEQGRLIPSEKGADFFLIVNDGLSVSRKRGLISQIQKIPQVLAAYDIQKGKVNNLDTIFEEIELHLI